MTEPSVGCLDVGPSWHSTVPWFDPHPSQGWQPGDQKWGQPGLLSPCPSQNPPSSFTMRPFLTLQPDWAPCPALCAGQPQPNPAPPHPQLLVLASCESSLTGPPWRWWRGFCSCSPQWHLSPWTCSSVSYQSPGRCLPPSMLFQHGITPHPHPPHQGTPRLGFRGDWGLCMAPCAIVPACRCSPA